jgi:hypothetical protein
MPLGNWAFQRTRIAWLSHWKLDACRSSAPRESAVASQLPAGEEEIRLMIGRRQPTAVIQV